MKYLLSGLLIFSLVLLSYCGNSDTTASCGDILPASQATFTNVYSLFNTSGDGSCTNCHSTANPTSHYDFSTKPALYDALKNHFEIVYGQVSSGMMPPEDQTMWTSSQLKTLRSWYCYGGFYEK